MKKSSIFALILSCALIAGCKNTGSGINTNSDSSGTDTGTTNTGTTDTGTTDTGTTDTGTTDTTPPHEHVGSGTYQYSDSEHWQVCECGERVGQTTHTYDQQTATEAYLKSAATCEAKAQYYYSCVCGKAGTTTFETGEKGPHSPETYWGYNESKHWHPCAVCGQAVGTADHVWQEDVKASAMKSKGDCTHPAVYYKTCECGRKSTETFEVPASGHTLSGYKHDLLKHWKECATCGEHIENPHTLTDVSTHSGSGTYSSVSGKCSVCNETIKYTTDESYTYEMYMSIIPTYTKGGELTITAAKNSLLSTFVFTLPSLEEDLARENVDRVYSAYQVYAASELANTTYKFGIHFDVNNIIRLLLNNDVEITDPYNIDLSGLVPVIRKFRSDCDDYLAEVPYTQTVANFFVEEISTLTGRGTVAAGTLNGASVKTDDPAKIYNPGSSTPISTRITGIIYARKFVDSIEAGYSCEFLLRGVDTTDIERGARIIVGDTEVTPITKGTASLRLFSKNEGGRHNPIFSEYRPQLYIGGIDVTAQLTFDEEMIMPGSFADLINFELIASMAITKGQLIYVREGGKTIGEMIVSSTILAGSTKLQLENDSDYHNGDYGEGYILYFDDQANATSVMVAPGDMNITLSESDGDSGTFLPSYVAYKVLEEHEEDLEITFAVELSNGYTRYPFRYSNYNNIGSISKSGYTSTLVLAGQPEDCPELFDASGKWHYSDSEILKLIVYIELGTNVM